MLTKLTIRNFKRFADVEIELGNPVVFIGPNNSGKTSAMQALALWDIGLKRWNEKRARTSAPEKRPGVAVNRRDLVAIPHPVAKQLWRDLHVRDVQSVHGKTKVSNVLIHVIVEGIDEGKSWACGLEFDYANEESFYCRPLRLDSGKPPRRMPIPGHADSLRIGFLPPMSGLAATETRLDAGAVNVRVGEGRTAEVLRNLCFSIHEDDPQRWQSLVDRIKPLFGVVLDVPRYVSERGEITMAYRERGVSLDLSSSGRGLQQTLLILAYMYANPHAVVLLDEPDAHLEILRQREIYELITNTASDSGNQIIAASHSEVLLNEAAGKDLVIAFVGAPHRIGGGRSQVRKALAEIGFEQYYQAEQTGWVLYLEGSTDLAILKAFAKRLDHQAALAALERPFVRYAGNQPKSAASHFHGLREALPDLQGVALFDNLDRAVPENSVLKHLVWNRREIENYLCTENTLTAYALATGRSGAPGPLFAAAQANQRLQAMKMSIGEVASALRTLDKGSPWGASVKVSDDFLTPLFRAYFSKLSLPNLMNKRNFYDLAEYVPQAEIDPEIGEKLDAIAAVAERAGPITDSASGADLTDR